MRSPRERRRRGKGDCLSEVSWERSSRASASSRSEEGRGNAGIPESLGKLLEGWSEGLGIDSEASEKREGAGRDDAEAVEQAGEDEEDDGRGGEQVGPAWGDKIAHQLAIIG